ncbi:MAG: ribonuclease P protein component [Pedosphaera sp.]|nr:ribonuclease P protein component [Pedosphaera sp.]
MPAKRAQTFPRTVRIQDSRDFTRLKDSGKRLSQGCLILNWHCGGAEAIDVGVNGIAAVGRPLPTTRLGVITSRRIGGSVVRNRARRLLREAFRIHRTRLQPGCDLVIIARKSIGNLGLAGVELDFIAACRRARLLQSEAAVI